MFNIILRGNSANSKIYHNGEEIKNISSVSISQQVGSIPTIHMEMIMNEGELFINEADIVITCRYPNGDLVGTVLLDEITYIDGPIQHWLVRMI